MTMIAGRGMTMIAGRGMTMIARRGMTMIAGRGMTMIAGCGMTGETVMNKALKNITAPLIFRLIDDAPHLPLEKKSGTQLTLNEFHEQIRQNLEILLNTRLVPLAWPEKYIELKNSVINYGISDFTLNFFGEKNNQHKLCQIIKETIDRFEPRIHKVRVTPLDYNVEFNRILKLRIECEVNLKPTPMPAIFESRLDASNRVFHVESN